MKKPAGLKDRRAFYALRKSDPPRNEDRAQAG